MVVMVWYLFSKDSSITEIFSVNGHKLLRIMLYCVECILLVASDHVNKFAFAWIGCWSRFSRLILSGFFPIDFASLFS